MGCASANRRGGGNQDDYDAYQVPGDGSAPARLLLHHTFGLWEAETSRDGQWLVVRSDEAEGKSSIRGRRLQDVERLRRSTVIFG